MSFMWLNAFHPAINKYQPYNPCHYLNQFVASNKICLYHGAGGPFLSDCPMRPLRPAVSVIQWVPIITATYYSDQCLPFFYSQSPCGFWLLKIPCQKPWTSIQFWVNLCVNASSLTKYPPSRFALDIPMQRKSQLLVLEGTTLDTILGHPWLPIFSPQISWTTSEVLAWSKNCFCNCLQLPKRSLKYMLMHFFPLNATMVKSPVSENKTATAFETAEALFH